MFIEDGINVFFYIKNINFEWTILLIIKLFKFIYIYIYRGPVNQDVLLRQY